jgi:hypothetical protein
MNIAGEHGHVKKRYYKKHRDKTTKATKRGGISQTIYDGWSKTRIEAEIAKCDVICSNCHRKHHWNELQN